jgi:hypothetical protein
MPRNYDEMRKARDLEFVLGDQSFTVHMLPVQIVDVWSKREKDVDLSDMVAFTSMCVDRIADAVADGNGSAVRWRELCDSPNGPSYGELLDLARWVWEVQSDLPTQESVPSQPGRVTTVASSTEG